MGNAVRSPERQGGHFGEDGAAACGCLGHFRGALDEYADSARSLAGPKEQTARRQAIRARGEFRGSRDEGLNHSRIRLEHLLGMFAGGLRQLGAA